MNRNARRHLVVDAGAAIRMKQLDRLGNELFTTPGVYEEVRERQAKQFLNLGPIELKVTLPTAEDIRFVRRFAKETGDLGFLSQNDIELIALVYKLQRQTGKTDHLRASPAQVDCDKKRNPFAWAPNREDVISLSATPEGAMNDEGSDTKREETKTDADGGLPGVATDPPDASDKRAQADPAAAAEICEQEKRDEHKENLRPSNTTAPVKLQDETIEDSDDESSVAETDLDDSDCGEWVTAENLHRFDVSVAEDEEIEVACVTTDYSVQNVLLMIGLHVVSIDGYKVRNLKLWGLLCRTCRHSFRDTTKLFCPKCGHSFVDRVPITVSAEDGKMTVHDTRKYNNKRGTIFTIPARKGGRQRPGQRDIILAEDELMIGGRDRELRRQQKLAQKEKMLRDPMVGDMAADQWCYRFNTKAGDKLNQFDARVEVGFGRRNPNSNNFRRHTGNKKK